MRIGTSINWLLIILIAFGFVLSDYLQVRGENTKLNKVVETQTDQLNQANDDLATCQGSARNAEEINKELNAANVQLGAKIKEMNSVNTSQQEAIDGMNIEIQACQGEKENQRKQLETLVAKNNICQVQNKQLAEENAFLKKGTQANGRTKNQVKPSEIILGVILVAQMTYTIAQKKRKTDIIQYHQSADYIRLSPEERSLIIQRRRKNRK